MKKFLGFLEWFMFTWSVWGIFLCCINMIFCILMFFGVSWTPLFGYAFITLLIFVFTLLLLKMVHTLIEKIMNKGKK
jgi:uncharacterized membrane protein